MPGSALNLLNVKRRTGVPDAGQLMVASGVSLARMGTARRPSAANR